MPTYSEVREHILRQVRRETAFLHMSTVRLDHSLAILRTLPPVPENMRWLCIVDWCLNDTGSYRALVAPAGQQNGRSAGRVSYDGLDGLMANAYSQPMGPFQGQQKFGSPVVRNKDRQRLREREKYI